MPAGGSGGGGMLTEIARFGDKSSRFCVAFARSVTAHRHTIILATSSPRSMPRRSSAALSTGSRR